MASEGLKRSFAEAVQDKSKLAEWLKANGSSATVEQVGKFLKSKQTSGEVSDDEIENVAGGTSSGGINYAVNNDCSDDWGGMNQAVILRANVLIT